MLTVLDEAWDEKGAWAEGRTAAMIRLLCFRVVRPG